MAALVISAAGAAIGGAVTGTMTGVQIGWALGSMLAPKPKTKITQPSQPLIDLKVTGTEYGQPIPWIRVSARVAGQMWWNTDRRPHTTSTTTTTGGKGGGGGVETTTKSTTYDMDVLYGLTSHEIVGITRIWEDGKLIWINSSEAPARSILASESSGRWSRLTVYTGDEDQLPDPTYEAAVGTENAPAYRDRGTVFIEGLQLGTSGQIPNFTFEVAMVASDGELMYSSAFTTCATNLMGNLGTWNTGPGGVLWDGSAAIRCFSVATGDIIAVYSPSSTVLDSCIDGFGDYWAVETNTKIAHCMQLGLMEEYTTNLGDTIGGLSLPSMHSLLFADDVIWYGWDPFGTGGILGRITIDREDLTATDSGALGSTIAGVIARNGAAVAGRVYSFSGTSAAACRWGYLNTSTLAYTTLKTFVQTGSLQVMLIGSDSHIYYGDLDGRRNYFVKYDQDGNFVAEVALPGVSSTGTSAAPRSIIEDRDGYLWVDITVNEVVGASGIYFKIDPATMTILESKTVTGANHFQCIGPSDFEGAVVLKRIEVAPGSGPTLDLIGPGSVLVPGTETVRSAQEAIFARAGLSASQYDCSPLAAVTKPVRSLVWSQVSPARQPTEWLMSAFLYEIVVSDKIYTRVRGAASVATIPYQDLGATEGGDMPEPLPLRQSNELELPARIAVTYANVSNDYQTDTQPSDRLISAVDDTVQEVTFAGLGMTPSEAKALADTMLLDRAASVVSTNIAILGDYCRLESTDPVTLTDADGNTFRMRLVKKTDSYPIQAFEAVLDDTSVLSSQGITDTDYESSTIVLGMVRTLMKLLDIPILQDVDDNAGFYVAAKGDGEGWPGAVVFDSPDGITYSRAVDVTESAVFGFCTTTLGDWTGPRVFDEINSVTVDVGEGTLESTTRAAILSSLETNAMLIGNELIQFRTATLSAPGVYVLTGLLRGGRGTEWAMVDHASDERCVLIRREGLRRIVLENNELGLDRYYKGVTLNSSTSAANAQLFRNTGVGLKPFSPFDPRITRDGSNNATLTWQRRSRRTVRTTGPLGISVPLGEEVELYEIDIYSNGTYTTVVDTLTATTTSVEYTAAEQTAAGLTPGNTIYAEVFQMSQVVGRGIELRAAA